MKKLFVLGSGISYSLSPKIFTKLFELFGETANYSIVDIKREELNKIRLLSEGAVGFNVTKPFKEEIIRYLKRDNSRIGSVNTVKADTMEGFSTDGDGLMFDLSYRFGAVESVLVLGYGGAARACVNAITKSGAKVQVMGRNQEKARRFAVETGIEPYDGSFIPQGIVSCTSETFVPKLSGEVEFCYDLRYSGDTLKIGRHNCNGMGMLLAQAIYSYGIFFDKRFDKAAVQSIYLKLKELL